MEFIVEANIPARTPTAMLESLFEQIDLVGSIPEVLFGEVGTDHVHVVFQVEAAHERRAQFEVTQLLCPVVHQLFPEAVEHVTLTVRETEGYEAQEAKRWSLPDLSWGARLFAVSATMTAATFLALHMTNILADKPGVVSEHFILNLLGF